MTELTLEEINFILTMFGRHVPVSEWTAELEAIYEKLGTMKDEIRKRNGEKDD